MIFGATWKLVVRGKKTQTRRPLQPAPRSEWIVRRDGSRRRRPPARVLQIDGELWRSCRYQPGQTYSVQPGRGRRGEHRILVTSVRRERAGDITYADARAEGFRTTDEFKIAWVRIHDRAWIDSEEIDRYSDALNAFGDGDPTTVGVVDWILLERFRQRHADTLVWVITFELERDELRLLGPAGSGSLDGDYTHQPSRALTDTAAAQALPETALHTEGVHPARTGCGCSVCRATASTDPVRVPEPEPVDDATLARFTADAAERRAGEPGRRAEDLRSQARSLAKRLREEADAGVRSGLDVIADLQRIEAHLKVLDRDEDAA